MLKMKGTLGFILVFFFFFFFAFSFSKQTAYAQVTATSSATVSFVPGQLLVTYKDGAAPIDTDQAATQSSSFVAKVQSFLQLQPNPEADQRALNIMQQRTNLEQKVGIKDKQILVVPGSNNLKRNYVMQLQPGTNVQAAAKTLTAQSDIVASVQPNYILHGSTTSENDPYFSLQWGLTKIQAPQAWDITKGSTAVTIALVDSGVDYNHPDLQTGNIIKGKDFSTCNAYDTTTGVCTSPKTCPQLANGYCDDDPMDDVGHGTHLAGIMAASTNNSIGVSGINWQVKLLAVKVAGTDNSAPITSIVQGIEYAADNNAKIINLSFDVNVPCSQTPDLQQAINYAFQKGALVVVAAGNGDSQGNPLDAVNTSPASCTNVIAVGATDPLDHRASYSNYGSTVTLAAPGGDMDTEGLTAGVLSTKASQCITGTGGLCSLSQLIYNTNYLFANGTSIAAPFVSGTAALLLAKNPSLTNQQLHDCLITNADPITTDHPIGPRLNAFKALTACAGSIAPTVTPTTTPTVGSTVLTFTVLLHGIGNSGDSNNPNDSSLSNKNPITKTRDVRVTMFDAQGKQIVNQLCSMLYSSINGNFTGTCNVGQISSGNYEIKITSPKYLTRIASNLQAITSGQTNIVPTVSLVAGDINGDNKLDISDYNGILGCYESSSPCSTATIASTDLNDDGVVNASDYNLFLRELTNQIGE